MAIDPICHSRCADHPDPEEELRALTLFRLAGGLFEIPSSFFRTDLRRESTRVAQSHRPASARLHSGPTAQPTLSLGQRHTSTCPAITHNVRFITRLVANPSSACLVLRLRDRVV